MDRLGPEDSQNDFQALIDQVSKGSPDAAWELVNRYGEQIRRAVRRVLNAKLRSQFDSLDFVQLVWKSLFCSGKELAKFQSPPQLIAFLVTIAQSKVRDEARRRLVAEKRAVTCEQSLDSGGGFSRTDLPDPGARPIDVAIAREQWNRLLSDQPPHYRRIIQLRLQGLTNEEIADMVGMDERNVRRFLKRLLGNRVK
jgi:RNA polymerase sigma factor (sigma-70 family)